MSIQLYSAGWCNNCRPVKHLLEENGLVYEPIDIDTPSGALRADKEGIKSIPTLVMWGIYHNGLQPCLEAISGHRQDE